MRVFVAGASGTLGCRLVPQLIDAGHEVIGTHHSPASAELLRTLGAKPVLVDLLDASAVRKAVLEHEPEAIVHQATALANAKWGRNLDKTFARTNALRTKGIDALLAAAREADVRRFVAQSFAPYRYAREGGPIKTEDDPLEPTPPPNTQQTAAAMTYLEQAVTAFGGIALRYGGFYGAANDALIELVLAQGIPRHLLGNQSGRPTEAPPGHTDKPLARLAGSPVHHSRRPRVLPRTPPPAGRAETAKRQERKPMSDLQTITDRLEIEALRGEFTDALMMRDYDCLASLFTQDGAVRIPHINAEAVSQEEIRAGVERMQSLWDYFVQTTHPGTIQLEGDSASGRAYISELMHGRDGRSQLNYSVYHDRYQRTPDGWKFTERVYEVRYLDTTPLAGSAPNAAGAAR